MLLRSGGYLKKLHTVRISSLQCFVVKRVTRHPDLEWRYRKKIVARQQRATVLRELFESLFDIIKDNLRVST